MTTRTALNLKPGDEAWLLCEGHPWHIVSKFIVENVTPKRIVWVGGTVTDHAGKGGACARFATPEEVHAHRTNIAILGFVGDIDGAIESATITQLIAIADLLGVAVPTMLRGQEET